MTIDGFEVMTLAEWDDVNDLWPYLANAAEFFHALAAAGMDFFQHLDRLSGLSVDHDAAAVLRTWLAS